MLYTPEDIKEFSVRIKELLKKFNIAFERLLFLISLYGKQSNKARMVINYKAT